MIEFTPSEVRQAAENPDVLRAVANQHDCSGVEAEAIDDVLFAGAIVYHANRAKELRAEADRLDELYGC